MTLRFCVPCATLDRVTARTSLTANHTAKTSGKGQTNDLLSKRNGNNNFWSLTKLLLATAIIGFHLRSMRLTEIEGHLACVKEPSGLLDSHGNTVLIIVGKNKSLLQLPGSLVCSWPNYFFAFVFASRNLVVTTVDNVSGCVT